MSPPLHDLCCLGCDGPLREEASESPEAGRLRCDTCEAQWPVLAGVPLLLPDIEGYVSSYREPLLATLAERGTIDEAHVALIADFALDPGAEPLRFGDDWTPWELTGTAAPAPRGNDTFAAMLNEAGAALHEAAESLLGELQPRVAVEVGAGAGAFTEQLARRCERLWIADYSLRAALTAGHRAALAGAKGELHLLVCDAEGLPFPAGQLDLVVALNLVDLLDDEDAFYAGLGDQLRPGGHVLLSTPDPAAAAYLDVGLTGAGLELVREIDGVPWLRTHHPRYHQLYFCRVVLARRPAAQ